MTPTAAIGYEEVTKEIFFDKIGPQDACVGTEGNFPYKSTFKLRNSHKLIGYIQAYYPTENKWPVESKYFLLKTG